MRPSRRGPSDALPAASPPLSPRPDLSRGRLLAVAIFIVVRDLIRGYWTTRGAEGRALHAAQPLRARRPARDPGRPPRSTATGRSCCCTAAAAARRGMLSQSLFDALHDLGSRAPVVLLPDGGDHSYWHNRADGKWGSMVLQEIVPTARPRRDRWHLDGRLRRTPPRRASGASARSAATRRRSGSAAPTARRARSTTPRTTRATTSSTTRRTTPRRSGSTSAPRIRSTTRPSTTRTRSTRSCTSGRAGTTAATGTRTCAQYLAFYARHCA